MKRLLTILALAAVACAPKEPANPDVARWESRAENVTITRDDWGIPHIKAPTDADAIFGLMYAQAEDDFNRIEVNFLNSQGRLAEAEGEDEIWRDLRMKLFIDPAEMRAQYAAAPDWLKALMDGWADGLNYYLHAHPEVKPRALTRFEPWMALTFSEGSIGGDIESVNLRDLEAFYGARPENQPAGAAAVGTAARSDHPAAVLASAGDDWIEEPRGSNGIAIAPANTTAGRALLLINPHTSFFFREEAHVTSDEGLNAYGALTWGQFFIYQGFNERAGWMHTSSSVDNIDEYLETVVDKGDGTFAYEYGDEERPVTSRRVTVSYKTDTGMAQREFTVFRTHHGPIVREQGGKWVAKALMEASLNALNQSYSRTKAKSLDEYKQIMELHTNSSNNTLYADADGNIAYFHSNFVPERNPKLDWSEPQDGSVPANDWQGVHDFGESPNVVNPASGWVYCTNNWPYSAAGPNSPKKADYPEYMDTGSENPRGVHAIMLLKDKKDFTPESLREAAYDSYLPAFADMIPPLLRAYDRLPASDARKADLADEIEALRGWDFRWAAESVPTSLAVFWGEGLMRAIRADAESEDMSIYDFAAKRATPDQLLTALDSASAKLEADFGTWQTPWGEINRFQRLTADIVQPFSDAGASIPVGFTSSRWGSLASFGARAYEGTKKWYGTSGNSFVAVVEFGDSVRAWAVTAGGLNSVAGSPHFNDQAERYATGDLREVYFYPNQLEGHTERVYKPGQKQE
ncbi:MAG: penicillin acylase family protein [Longimicrobiales bacterium]